MMINVIVIIMTDTTKTMVIWRTNTKMGGSSQHHSIQNDNRYHGNDNRNSGNYPNNQNRNSGNYSNSNHRNENYNTNNSNQNVGSNQGNR